MSSDLGSNSSATPPNDFELYASEFLRVNNTANNCLGGLFQKAKEISSSTVFFTVTGAGNFSASSCENEEEEKNKERR